MLRQLGVWSRAASAWADWQGGKVARFGDNMREVAVTEGDKVQSEIQFGYSTNGYGIGDLVKYVNDATDAEVDTLIKTYLDEYDVVAELKPGGARHSSLRDGEPNEPDCKRGIRQPEPLAPQAHRGSVTTPR